MVSVSEWAPPAIGEHERIDHLERLDEKSRTVAYVIGTGKAWSWGARSETAADGWIEGSAATQEDARIQADAVLGGMVVG